MMYWIRLYVNHILCGTTFEELDAEERGVWFSLLVLAGYSQVHGKLCVSERVPYSKTQIAELLKLPPKVIEKSLKKLIEVGKIGVDGNGILTITNWKKYQTEYQRQSSYKKGGTNEHDKVPYQKKEVLQRSVEVLDELPEPIEVEATTPVPDEVVEKPVESQQAEPVPETKPEKRRVGRPKGAKTQYKHKPPKEERPDMAEILASFPESPPERIDPEPDQRIEDELMKETDEPLNADELLKKDDDEVEDKTSESVMSPEYKTHLFIKSYCDAYKTRYKTYPAITKRVQGVATRLVTDLGLAKAQDYIKTYLTMEDQWFKTKAHDLDVFENNLNKVKVQNEASKVKAKPVVIKTAEEIEEEDRARLDARERVARIMRDNPVGKVMP